MPEPNPAKENIQAIASLDEAAFDRQSVVDRISARISQFVGSLWFVILHLVWFVAWALWNLHVVPGLKPFDPFPFGLLTMIVSLEGVLVSTFVLITQNWMSRQADRRAHLDLQVNILAEQEMTMVLKMLREIGGKLDARAEPDEKVQQFVDLDVHQLAGELDHVDPGEGHDGAATRSE
jgi:uncharacterized membrane protein